MEFTFAFRRANDVDKDVIKNPLKSMMAFSEDSEKIEHNDGGYFRAAPCMNERRNGMATCA